MHDYLLPPDPEDGRCLSSVAPVTFPHTRCLTKPKGRLAINNTSQIKQNIKHQKKKKSHACIAMKSKNTNVWLFISYLRFQSCKWRLVFFRRNVTMQKGNFQTVKKNKKTRPTYYETFFLTKTLIKNSKGKTRNWSVKVSLVSSSVR